MPKPMENETKDEFITRCIPIVIEDGTADDQDQAVAVCMSMWEKKTSTQPPPKGGDEKAITKKEEDGEHPASHYLVVENPEKTTTWHLRVKDMDGNPDHRLMGAAWAALHEGYRGNQYEGPGKQEAISKLKGMYEAEEMDLPGKAEIASSQKLLLAMTMNVKALENWELEVLAVPFGGPNDGKDEDGEYFSERTKLHLENFNNPLVTYYHGYTTKGEPQGDPEKVGEVKPDSWQKQEDGWWVRVMLDKASELAKRIWESAKEGLARASSGSIMHLVRKTKDGEILNWPIGELALFDAVEGRQPANAYAMALPVMKAHYEKAGQGGQVLDLSIQDLFEQPEIDDPGAKDKGEKTRRSKAASGNDPATNKSEIASQARNDKFGGIEMDELEVKNLVAEAVKSALTERDKAEETKKEAAKAEQEKIDAAVKAERERLEKEYAEKHRLPYDEVHVAKFGDLWKYDNLSPDDQAFMVGVLMAAKTNGHSKNGATEPALKALAIKIIDAKEEGYGRAKAALKMAGIPMDAAKANDINYSTYSGYGDQWVPATYSSRLWDKIRLGTPVVGNIPTVIVPQGQDSIPIPIMGASATFYNVAEATAMDANPGATTKTVTVSKPGTSSQTLSVGKLGAAISFTGELEEDSVIPWASTMRNDLEKEGVEVLESLTIDGDTETTSSTNINDIASAVTSGSYYLTLNGFRKLALVTNTANSRAAGALTVEDFLETVKLMGLGGRNAVQRDKVAIIIDLWTHWKALELPEIKTKDAYSQPTIEGGMLASLWGYKVIPSANMHRPSADTTYGLKANSSGKIDQDTAANNAYGAILAVRWDQWQLGMKRNWIFETQRVPRADVTEITALARVGLVYRDTEASAISYGVIV